MILINLQKVFDTLDHDVLLKNMECVGFKKPVIKWFESYLSNRKNFCINWKSFLGGRFTITWSSARFYSRTTPFLIYINNLPQSLSETASNLYVDDTSIYYQHRDIQKIENILNKEFSSLCEWFINKKIINSFRGR